jgi:hypothetical protein
MPSGTQTVVPVTAAELKVMNNENSGDVVNRSGNNWVMFFFPKRVTITHYFADAGAFGGQYRFISTVETSEDTTNGYDGTWTGRGSISHRGTAIPGYRTLVAAVPQPLVNVKTMRVLMSHSAQLSSSQIATLHLYGKRSEDSDRLEFWHPTLNQPLSDSPAHLDWGNRPRGTSESRQVRVKNVSNLVTATNITVGMEALTDANPTFVSQHQFAYEGGPLGAAAVIPSLAPGEISGLVTIQQSLLATAVLSLWTQRIYATAGGWVS